MRPLESQSKEVGFHQFPDLKQRFAVLGERVEGGSYHLVPTMPQPPPPPLYEKAISNISPTPTAHMYACSSTSQSNLTLYDKQG